MDTIALIIGGLALLGVIYAVLRINRVAQDQDRDIKALRSKLSHLEQELKKLRAPAGQQGRSTSNQAQATQGRSRNEPRQPEQRQTDRPAPQKQQQPERQNERSLQKQQQPERQREQRERQPQQDRAQQPQQERTPPPRERAPQQQRERPKQANTPKPKPLPMPDIDLDQITGQEAPVQQLIQAQEPAPEAFAAHKYAIIPEDGMIRQHQLQVQPESDSYIEVDMPKEGQSNFTSYRFNLSGNQAFVISQGIERLEDAFEFEKPSTRKVSRILQQGDGVLAKTESGWRIQEKAKIDFR